MTRIASLVALSAAAAALQLPLQRPINDIAPHSAFHARPLVSSGTLQDTIDKDRLWDRAEELYALARKSEDEFNHPTRVIGSAGMRASWAYVFDGAGDMSLTGQQDTRPRSSTSSLSWLLSEAITMSRSSHSTLMQAG